MREERSRFRQRGEKFRKEQDRLFPDAARHVHRFAGNNRPFFNHDRQRQLRRPSVFLSYYHILLMSIPQMLFPIM